MFGAMPDLSTIPAAAGPVADLAAAAVWASMSDSQRDAVTGVSSISARRYNTGVPRRTESPVDDGRLTGASAALKDEFNCRSRWSDARERCSELEFLVASDHTLERAYKVPSLRNVAERAPFMDAGQFATLDEVLDHYNRTAS